MFNSGTSTNIVYVDYSTSSAETARFETSSKPDSLSNIMKNGKNGITVVVDSSINMLSAEQKNI